MPRIESGFSAEIPDNTEIETMSEKPNVIYTGHFVDEPSKLLDALPPRINSDGSRVYAHHVTKEFKPDFGLEGVEIGTRRTIFAIGQLCVEGVHVALVESSDDEELTSGEHPHITIATEEGVSPVESNRVLREAHSNNSIEPIDPPIPIEVTEGYFDGKNDITSHGGDFDAN